MTPGTFSNPGKTSRQFCIRSPLITRRCGSKPRIARCNVWLKPVITDMTTISTVMPSVTPNTETTVMTETKVRLGWR